MQILNSIASSSCSYAVIALARSIFQKGASFIAAMAFELASTNLVIELGIILFVILGWQFTAAEYFGGILKAPRAQAAGVLSGASTLPLSLCWREQVALVWLGPDFEADGLRHGAHPCFGAKTAPLSPVEAPVHVRPASAPPHFPRQWQPGHMTGSDGLLRA